jgi:hypothetical protein
MTAQPPKPTLDDITAFARRHGLERVAPEHLARMTELAAYVADLGRTLPRPTRKDDAPASTFGVARSREW